MWWLLLTTALAGDWSPSSDDAKLVYEQLSLYHPPECDVVDMSLDEGAEAFLEVANNATHPPHAPMRAAQCALALYPESSKESAVKWVSSDNQLGLARLALRRLDVFEPQSALEVAQAAMNGPFRDRAVPMIQASVHSDVRALLTQPEPVAPSAKPPAPSTDATANNDGK